jgi:hypothetical protein
VVGSPADGTEADGRVPEDVADAAAEAVTAAAEAVAAAAAVEEGERRNGWRCLQLTGEQPGACSPERKVLFLLSLKVRKNPTY